MRIRTHRSKIFSFPVRVVPFFIWISCFFLGGSYSQEVLDRIVAVVGNEIITESELKMQLGIYLGQMRMEEKSQQEEAKLKQELLEQMINNKLLLLQAQKDTTIEVTSKEVDDAVKEQLKKVKAEFSEDAFQAQLQAEGLTESELKEKIP